MSFCTGVDLIEVRRIAKSIENPRFLLRCFSSEERSLFRERGFHPATIAANFCAKEAFSKAIGTGLRGFRLADVSVLRGSMGRPYLKLSGNAAKLAGERGLSFDVSLSHTREYAVASVIAYPTGGNPGNVPD